LTVSVPFLAMLVTQPWNTLRYIQNSLGLLKNSVPRKLPLDLAYSFLCAIPIHGTFDDHADLNMLVPELEQCSKTTIPGDVPNMMVFVDNVSVVMYVVHQLRWLLPASV
jgi:hypothetical protein